jgi:predicted RNA binding protein YcfA (HicA-like mRNA interferase family)
LVSCQNERQSSSFHHPAKNGTVTVSGKESIDVPIGTLNSVLKQAGLKK